MLEYWVRKAGKNSKGRPLYEARFIDFEHGIILLKLSPDVLAEFLKKERKLLARYNYPQLERLAALSDQDIAGMVSRVFPDELWSEPTLWPWMPSG